MKIGKNFKRMQECSFDISHCWLIVIGDDVTFSERVRLFAHDASTKMHLTYARIGKVKIGNKVFVGADTVILPGVTIGDNVIIGAGSVVSKDIAEGHVAAGNPARIISNTDDFIEKRRKEMNFYPCFGDNYTIRENISFDMKNEMIDKMNNDIGYVK